MEEMDRTPAEVYWERYCEFKEVGFTDEQAFDLLLMGIGNGEYDEEDCCY